MHHYRVFAHRKQNKVMDQQDPPASSPSFSPSPRRKLIRRNAAKNFAFKPFSSLPVSEPTTFSTNSSNASRTRSLERNTFSERSLRIEGYDGQLGMVYQSLGLRGPEDFEISREAWEIYRESSDVSEHKSSELNFDEPEEPSLLEARGIQLSTGDALHDSQCTSQDIQVIESVPLIGALESLVSDINNAAGARGIKGDRPPLLTPPPLMSRPGLDNASTWDLFNGLAPNDDDESRCKLVRKSFSSDDEDDLERAYHNIPAGQRLGDTIVQPVSTSFISSADDDSSSTTTDPTPLISPDGRSRVNITNWQKGDPLGKGSFGTVYEGFASAGKFFAIKEVSLVEPGSRKCMLSLEKEIEMLSNLEHDHIVKYLGTDKDESNLYIFLEHMKNSLEKIYKKFTLEDSQVSVYTRQILLGLIYLHDQGIVHRDIKCANILVDTNGTVKLADFGLAKVSKLNDLKSSQGTPLWMAPEVVNRKSEGYGTAADIWSLGCTVLEMLTGQLPYHPSDPFQAIYKIGRGVLPDIPPKLSKDSRDFIMKCLQVDPSARPCAAQLLQHPFISRPLPPHMGPESPAQGRWH